VFVNLDENKIIVKEHRVCPVIFLTLFEISASKYIFRGHVTSSATWPVDSPYAISYWCPIGTVFEILGLHNPCVYNKNTHTHAASDFIFCPMQCMADNKNLKILKHPHTVRSVRK